MGKGMNIEMVAFVAILVFFVFTQPFATAGSDVIYVDDDGGPGIDFTKIQDAVDKVTSSCDTIYVYAGIYYENVDVDKSLILIGEDLDTTIINGSGNRYTLEIEARECKVSGFTIRNGDHAGVYLSGFGGENTLSDNKIIRNGIYGIMVGESHYNIIKDNIISDNGVGNVGIGIHLWGSYNNILNNTLTSNIYSGIDLCYQCNNNTLINNTACDNGYSGLTYNFKDGGENLILNNKFNSNEGHGIGIYKSDGNDSFKGNEVSHNGATGIKIAESDNNEIIGNTAIGNYNWGISVEDSNGNLIYYNNLRDNAKGGHHANKNARDKNGNNQWDKGYPSGGNYYSDYTGLDEYRGPYQNLTGSDGIGDTPYDVEGSSSAQDRYPFMNENGWQPPYTKTDVGVASNITPASPTDLASYLPPEYKDLDISDSIVLNVNVTDITPDTTDAAYTDITINVGKLDIETCKVFKTDIGFLPEVEDVTTLPTVSGEPVFSRDLVNKTVTVRLYVGDPLLGVIPAAVEAVFDTGEGTYPSIMGTHNGTITPSRDINVSKLYTYPCAGTGGHADSIKLYENATLIANGSWEGYEGDWHNITIENGTGAPYVMLLKGHEYKYSIVTGSYPQIIHSTSKEVTGGTISCSSFVDANGKIYYDWIPAIRLD